MHYLEMSDAKKFLCFQSSKFQLSSVPKIFIGALQSIAAVFLFAFKVKTVHLVCYAAVF